MNHSIAMGNLEDLVNAAIKLFDNAESIVDLEQIKAQYLGKTGEITILLKGLRELTPEERPVMGERINQAKKLLEDALIERRNLIQEKYVGSSGRGESGCILARAWVGDGRVHPVTRTLIRIESLFHLIGFGVATGPEIETDFYNFTALNIAENHPARAMHDTFYVDGGKLLRTHTSPVQIHYMQNHRPPIKLLHLGGCIVVTPM